MRNVLTNEHGFCYGKWYEFPYIQGITYYVNFQPYNKVYFFVTMEENGELVYANALSTWELNDENKIVLDLDNVMISYNLDIMALDTLATYVNESVIISMQDEMYKVIKNEYGVYNQAIYEAKDPKQLGSNIKTQAIFVLAETKTVYKSTINSDGTVSNLIAFDEKIDSESFEVSSDGKTIIYKTGEKEIEYVLVEDIYELQ